MDKNLENFPIRLKKNEKGGFFGIISKKDNQGKWINKAMPINVPKRVQEKASLNKVIMIDGKLNPTAFIKDGERRYSFEILIDDFKEFDINKLQDNVKIRGFVQKQTSKSGKEFYTLSIRSENLNEQKREKIQTTKDFVYNTIIVNAKKDVLDEMKKYEGKYIESEGFLNLNDYNNEVRMNYYVREIHEPSKEISDKEKEEYMYKDLQEVDTKDPKEKSEEVVKKEDEKEPEPEMEM